MEWFINLISSSAFIDLISTFGLAVVLVLYFVFYRDPKHIRFWQTKYDDLSKNYGALSNDYTKLEASLHPESRMMSKEQALKLCYVALDRDFYKLYRRCCEKIDGARAEDVSVFIQESIIDTNEVWAKFTSPFPKVPRITDLYGVYKNKGGKLKNELQEIMDSAVPENEKKDLVWNKLLQNTINMKREFSENLQKLKQGTEVKPYKEPESVSEESQGS